MIGYYELGGWVRNRQTAQRLFRKGMGNDLEGVAGTLWAAYNGVAEMVDCGRNRRTPDQHLDYLWFGGGSSLKVRAFVLAKKLTLQDSPAL
jgi:hypothetical protein